MTQVRLWNYGDTFTSERVSTSQTALHEAGVYSGYRITVTDTDKIELSSGFALLPNGILVGETVAQEMILAIAPAAATIYTITVRHTDSDVIGGSTAVYALETGELTPADVTDGVVLGYIRHPGAAVALDSSFMFEARLVSNQAEEAHYLVPTLLSAPFSSKWVADTLGANTSIADTFISPLAVVTRVETDGLGPVPPGYEVTTVQLPLVAGTFRPYSLSIRAQIDPNSVLVASLIDTLGASVTLTDYTISPSATFADFLVSIDYASGVFTSGSNYLLSLEFRTPQLDSIDIQSITINYDPLP